MSPVVVEPWAHVALHGPGQRHQFFRQIVFFIGAEDTEGKNSLFYLPHHNLLGNNAFQQCMAILVLFRSHWGVFGPHRGVVEPHRGVVEPWARVTYHGPCCR